MTNKEFKKIINESNYNILQRNDIYKHVRSFVEKWLIDHDIKISDIGTVIKENEILFKLTTTLTDFQNNTETNKLFEITVKIQEIK